MESPTLSKELERIKRELELLPVKETEHPAWQKFIVEQLKWWILDLETKTPR